MVRTVFQLTMILFSIAANSQSIVALPPRGPIVEGEPFQVQYIIRGAKENPVIKAPSFFNFQLVNGPNTFKGTDALSNADQPLYNETFTLRSVLPGKFSIPPAYVIINGKEYRSNTLHIDVISKEEAVARLKRETGESEYFLKPGEDPYKKIRENLYVKVSVNKQSCFVGEPILATFKLYSRLESRSDIVKNPGFYGFSMYDMIGVDNKQLATEQINGRVFDVHTIRKVQLYPLQAGNYTIDPMEINNKVEFSKTGVNKKTEQEVIEGLWNGDENPEVNPDAELFETTMRTEPISINVKSLPSKNIPDDYKGAVGKFSVTSTPANGSIPQNKQAFLEITISGTGNFIQLDAPEIKWPDGVEGFEPVIEDQFDSNSFPLQGARIFRYPFVCSAMGSVQLPAISFTYFDRDSNSYKTITTRPLPVNVVAPEAKAAINPEHKGSIEQESEFAARKAGFIVVGLVVLVVLYWIVRKKEVPPPPVVEVLQPEPPSIHELLKPAYEAAANESDTFYSTLYRIVLNYLGTHLDMAPELTGKNGLITKMKEAGWEAESVREWERWMAHCEMGIYTNADLAEDRTAWTDHTAAMLEKIVG